MRGNKPVVIGLLTLVLLLGVGIGVFIVMNPGKESGNGTKAGELTDDTLAMRDSGTPLDSNPDGPATGKKGDDTKTDPEKNQPTTHKPGNGDSDNGGNGNSADPDTKPDPDNVGEYKPFTTEFTVRGRVTMKSDGRVAVGAGIKIQTGNDITTRRIREARSEEPEQKDRPAPEIVGEGMTDGAGEFTITVSYKTWHHADADKNFGNWRIWDRDPVIVVASMPGYAPARSGTIQPEHESEHEVNLRLAVPAAVTGRVIDALTRDGIAGARVELRDADTWRGGGGGSAAYEIVTDSDGYFSQNSLPASNYILRVNARGYADHGGFESGRVNVSGGGERDLGEIALLPTASVVGRVIDEQGKPLAGATVELHKRQEWGSWSQAQATSGEDGHFEIVDVDPGAYTVKARLSGMGVYTGESLTIESAVRTDLGDIVLEKGLEISGIVVGPDDKPVEGANVGLQETSEDFFWMVPSTDPSIKSTTDEEGRFVLAGASQGRWDLSVKADGFAVHRQVLKVEGALKGLKIKLQVGGGVSGRVVEADGSPVSGMTVAATNHTDSAYSSWKSMPEMLWGTLFMRHDSHVTTDDEGRFTIRNLPAGTYLLAASSFGDSVAYADNILVKDGADTADVEIRFPGKGAARITVTEDGVPVSGLKVGLSRNQGYMDSDDRSGVTDAMGGVRLEDVPAGAWYVLTGRDEGGFDTDHRRRRLTIVEGKTVEFTLELRPRDGVRLHGRLTMNGKHVFQDVILLGLGDRADVMKNASTVDGGFYEFAGLKTGAYVLHARASDTEITAKVTLNLDEEGDFPFDKDFMGYNIRGLVITPDSSPAQLASVTVALQHASNEQPQFATWLRGRGSANAEGAFSFTGVAPGTYVLSASLDGVGSVSANVTVAGGDVSGLKLEISQNSGSIKLTIGKLNGKPVSGNGFGMVTLARPDGTPVDPGGGFQGMFMLAEGATQNIPTIEAGTYTVTVEGSGYMSVKLADVVVKTGEATLVETDMTAGAELHVTFTNPEVTQEMLDAARVRYYNASGVEVPREASVFDAWAAAESPESPTLIAKYISKQVTEVRIKLAGYTELVIPVEVEPGEKLTRNESAVAE